MLASWPGGSGKGSSFPPAEARAAARDLLPELARHRRVVVAGWRAARALGFRADRYLVWEAGPTGRPWAVLPHPSGVNRWWNDADALDAARRFLLKTAA